MIVEARRGNFKIEEDFRGKLFIEDFFLFENDISIYFYKNF